MDLEKFLPLLQITNTIITVLLNLSPIVSFIMVFKGKHKYTYIPKLMLIFNALNNVLWACYWYRTSKLIPLLNSIICSIISCVFGFFYLYLAFNKNYKKIAICSILLIIIQFNLVLFFLKIMRSLKIFGIILIIINIMMFVAPGQNLIKVFKEKNYKLIPIATTIMGCFCSGGWFLFGIIVNDINCIIPNGLGLISSIFTTFVWVYFYVNGIIRKTSGDEKELKEEETNGNQKNKIDKQINQKDVAIV